MFLLARVCLLVLVSAPVYAKVGVSVFRIENRQRAAFSVEARTQWAWGVREGEARVLSLMVSLRSSAFTQFQQVKTQSGTAKAMVKGDRLVIKMDGVSEKLLLRGGTRTLALEIQATTPGELIDENCKALNLALKPQQSSLPFYVGTSCEKKGESVGFSVTFPREVNVTSSTLFESKGKGEPWRFYELGKVQVASGTLGKVGVEYLGKNYEFNLESVKSLVEDVEKPNEQAKLALGAGFGLFSIAGDINPSAGTPYITLKVPHYPVWEGLGVMLNGSFALPLSQTATSQGYSQFELYAGYELKFGGMFIARPKVGYVVFNHSHNDTGISLTANQVGAGVVLGVRFGTMEITLDGMMCSFGSSVTTGHYSIDLGFLSKSGPVGWGFGARLQSFTAVGTVTRNFSQTLFYGLVAI